MTQGNQSNLNRLGIFFFYDKDGIVDNYVVYLLEEMKKNLKDLLIVCNGKLTSEGREKFNVLTESVIVRENKGFDVWAYKEGIEYITWENIITYDEVVFFNSTIFGPLYSFTEMFETMWEKKLDFWGITKHHQIDYNPFGVSGINYIPEHIQSHFIVIRKRMLTSYDFKNYWEKTPEINSYEEAVVLHEGIFTKKFSDKGFQWDVYVDTSDLEKHVQHPLIMMPLELIKNRKCPIIKRRSFFHPMSDFLNNTTGEPSIQIYEFLKNNVDYDMNFIWDNILRTCNQADIKNALNLNYILPTTYTDPNIEIPQKRRIALIIHIYFEDLIEYCYKYASSMPKDADIYITTNSEEKKKLIVTTFEKLECGKLEIIVIENRGRDISALLVACKDFLLDYDYVCFAHDKKTTQVVPYIRGESFSYKCFENVLTTPHYVQNVLKTFEENPRLGMLSPPPPNHADFYPTIGMGWSINYDITENLAKKLEINVDLNRYKDPIAPLGTIFWFRPKALKTLIEYDWEYSDFPKEPNNTDGTLLHAIERIYPIVSQHEGYYPAWVLADSFARIELTNVNYMLSEINKQYFSKYGPTYHPFLVMNLHNNFLINVSWKDRLKIKLKKYLPQTAIESLKRIKKIIKN